MTNYLEEFTSYIQAERRLSPLTVRNYRRDIERFVHWCEQEAPEGWRLCPFQVEEVDSERLREWVLVRGGTPQKGGSQLSTASLNREIASLRCFFRYLLRTKVIQKDPTRGILSLKTAKRLPNFVPESRMHDLLDRSAEEPTRQESWEVIRQARNKLIVELLYGCGLRLAELIGINRDDLLDGCTTLRVVGKGNKERRIPLAKRLRRDILSYISQIEGQNICKSEKKALILTQKGERISRITVYRIVKQALREGGVQGKQSPHVLRHTFATHLLNHGADMREIQELMGHTSLRATQVYTHNSIAQLQKIYHKAHPREGVGTKPKR